MQKKMQISIFVHSEKSGSFANGLRTILLTAPNKVAPSMHAKNGTNSTQARLF